MKNDVNVRIADARVKMRLTQSGMAERLNIKRSTYAYIESRGNPKPRILKEIAFILGVTTDYLLYGTELPVSDKSGEVAVGETEVDYKRTSENFEVTAEEKKLLKMLRTLPKNVKNDYLTKISEEYEKGTQK